MTARIILLHGASSSGKSTLAKAIQLALDEPFLNLSSDMIAPGLPARRDQAGAFAYLDRVRPRFFDGFHRSIVAFAAAGNDLVVDHVIEFASWRADLRRLLAPFDVFLVGVHCTLDEIDRRERERGDRWIGEGRSHVQDGIHTFGPYDLDLDTTGGVPAELASLVLAGWRQRAATVL